MVPFALSDTCSLIDFISIANKAFIVSWKYIVLIEKWINNETDFDKEIKNKEKWEEFKQCKKYIHKLWLFQRIKLCFKKVVINYF